jgi:hypothetical protein
MYSKSYASQICLEMSETVKNLAFVKLIDTKKSKLASRIIKSRFKTKENCVLFIDSNVPVKEKVIAFNETLIECHDTLPGKFDR